jgi:predicted glycosyltransferase
MSSASPSFPSAGFSPGARRSVLIHCQYVYGIGHFVRAVELARSLARHFDVHLVSGGEPVPNFALPDGVEFTQLPAIFKDEMSGSLIPLDGTTSLDDCLGMRAQMLADLVRAHPPDILVTEHFPFGLLFEIEALKLISQVCCARPGTLIVTSVRDVIESEHGGSRDAHICEIIDRFFDLVMVHGDERVVALRASFPLIDRITVPLIYTGYVVATPPPARPHGGAPLLVGAIGGGRVGQELLSALALAHRELVLRWQHELLLFRGAFDQDAGLSFAEGGRLKICAFDRAAYRQALAEATGVICLGGYNSVLEALSMSLPTLVYKRTFLGGNREQALRTELFAASGLIRSFEKADLAADRLVPVMYTHFATGHGAAAEIDFQGAENACRLLLAASENRKSSKWKYPG